jgi:hypothetical protein
LVLDEAHGAGHLYRLEGDSIESVREYMEDVWGKAAARFRLFAENTRDGQRPW